MHNKSLQEQCRSPVRCAWMYIFVHRHRVTLYTFNHSSLQIWHLMKQNVVDTHTEIHACICPYTRTYTSMHAYIFWYFMHENYWCISLCYMQLNQYHIMLEEYPKQSIELCIKYTITNAQYSCHKKWVYSAKHSACWAAWWQITSIKCIKTLNRISQ